jgi:hypothetical protein
MARDWHETFKKWAKAPSETEEERGSRAARMINEAVREDLTLASKSFDVYATGSYRNNTNVRLASDIDVAIVLKDCSCYEHPKSGPPQRDDIGYKDATYGLTEFRDSVGKALKKKFGEKGVTAGDKAFNIHENTYRLDADASVFVLYKRYTGAKNADGTWQCDEGVAMRPKSDPAKQIVNWHQQHYDQGVARNTATRRRFKRVTRILKLLRDEMREQGTAEAKAAAAAAPSFLLECLTFNAPDACFNLTEGSYHDDVKATILKLWNATKDDSSCSSFMEVSRMKSLFGVGQPWTRAQAQEFLLRAWHFVGFSA